MQSTETGAIFAGTGSEIRMRKKKKASTGNDDINRKRKGSDSHSQTESVSKKQPTAPNINNADAKAKTESRKVKAKSKKQVKRKKKNNKPVEIDGSTVENIEKIEKYRKNEDDVDGSDINDKASKENVKNQNEDDVLMSLFRSSGIHSALKHDKIEQAGNPDYVLVEKEAERVAKQAINALRQSRVNCRVNGYAVPTWTGRSHSSDTQVQQPTAPKRRFGKKNCGSSGSSSLKIPKIADKEDENVRKRTTSVSEASNKFDLESETVDVSSSALLARMRRRNAAVSGNPTSSTSGDGPKTEEDKLLNDIEEFVKSKCDCIATSDELTERFKARVKPGQNAVFKELLKQLCTLRKEDGKGSWVLRDEFR